MSAVVERDHTDEVVKMEERYYNRRTAETEQELRGWLWVPYLCVVVPVLAIAGVVSIFKRLF